MFNAKFDDLRLILSIQGYALNYQYIVREIGFWSRQLTGVIPFNCKLNRSQLDNISLKNIHICVQEQHGIPQKKIVDNGLASSDAFAVIKCLYHVTKCEQYDADYIGVLREENISPIIYKAGLGNYIYELDNLELFKNSSVNLLSLSDIKYIITNEPTKYNYCSLHDRLRNEQIPICAKVKCEIIANYIQQIIQSQQQQQHQGQPQQQSAYQNS